MMLIGRAYRKAISQALGYAIYRWFAIWILIAACASYGSSGQAVSLAIIAINISLSSNFRAVKLLIDEQSRQDWRDRLTNRFFYQLFWDSLKSGDREYLDIDNLFQEAGKKATADIKSAADAEHEGFWDSGWWHTFGGVLHFIGALVTDVVYYGSAFWVGSRW
jgi:hypothetical protein